MNIVKRKFANFYEFKSEVILLFMLRQKSNSTDKTLKKLFILLLSLK